jgi:hypothetical protein
VVAKKKKENVVDSLVGEVRCATDSLGRGGSVRIIIVRGG